MYKIKRPEIVLLKKNASGQMEEGERFSDEKELVNFLARFHKPILSCDGNPIHGQFQNAYMDFQCLSGEQLEKGYHYCGIDNIYVYGVFDKIWTPYSYQFYVDIPGTPLYDVRNLEPEVRKAYYERQKQKPERKTRLQILEEWEKWCRTKQGRKTHTCCNTRRSNGWKDNPGNKYRKQWERGAVRKFKKEVKETQSK